MPYLLTDAGFLVSWFISCIWSSCSFWKKISGQYP